MKDMFNRNYDKNKIIEKHECVRCHKIVKTCRNPPICSRKQCNKNYKSKDGTQR